MALLADVISWALILAGGAVSLIGGWGLLRLPDVFARMHGASIVDTLGLGLILVGLMFQAGFTLITVKLILILLFVFYTSPTTTHALARACLYGGVEPEAARKDGPREDGARKDGEGAPPSSP